MTARASVYATAIVTIAVLWFLLGAILSDPKPVSLTVSPLVAFAPVGMHIEIVIPRHPDNRALAVWWDEGAFSVTLEGEHAPVLWVRDVRKLEPGEQEVIAVLYGPAGKSRGTDRVRVIRAGERD